MRFPLCSLTNQINNLFYSGTYFGTRVEYDTLNIEAQLGTGSLIKVDIIDDWLGTVLNWAEEEVVLQVVGSIVSSSSNYPRLYSFILYSLIARRFLLEES